MKLEALKTYRDMALGKVVKAGETIETDKERAETLIKIGYAKEPGKATPWERKDKES